MTDALAGIEPMVVDSRSLASQVTARLRELIADGSLPGGVQLPTEPELADRFRVARTTVREALKQLENEGSVVVRRGRGRFVSAMPALQRPITRLESVTEMLASQGYHVENRVLSVQTRAAEAQERERLRLAEDAEVLALERLRLHRGEPLIYSLDVVPADLLDVPPGTDWQGSLFDMLAARGMRPVTAATTIRASRLEPKTAAICGTDPALPWLHMIQLHLLDDGSPVVYSNDYHRGDRFSFDLLRRSD